MNLETIISKVEKNFSPHAWDRVVLKLIPELHKREIRVHNFKGIIEIDTELISLINKNLLSLYGKDLKTI